jgi:hypothetical protein
VFKRIWKTLDPESRFVGTGGPVNPADLSRHLAQVHRGVGEVHVDQTTRPGHTDIGLDRAAPLANSTSNHSKI